jgi:hypothetical protein
MLLKDFSEDKEYVICMNCFRLEDRPLKNCISVCSIRGAGTFNTTNLGGHLSTCIGDT